MMESQSIKTKRKNWKNRSHRFDVQRQKNKANKAERRRRHHKPYSQSHQFSLTHVINTRFPGYTKIHAPKHFSLIDNEKDALKFLNDLKVAYEKQEKVLVMLNRVREISSDAILVLLSNMVRFKTAGIEFNGLNPPKNSKACKKLESSGFFEQLYGRKTMAEQESYTFQSMSSRIYTHGQKTVSSEDADKIIEKASKVIWGEPRRCPGAQNTLVELMHNTFDHAGKDKGEKHWWLSVEHDNKNKEVTFSFIDFGVGIFRSLENKSPDAPLYGALERILIKFPMATQQVDKLKLILEGKVQLTQSKEYFRGKGLANIYSFLADDSISSLSIISNEASVNVEKNDYHKLDIEFLGTFISFKINNNTKSLKWQIW